MLGRAELYACELAAFDGTDLEAVRAHHTVAAVIERLVAEPWWAGPPVRVEAARSGAMSSATHGPVSNPDATAAGVDASRIPVTIRLAAGQATIATAAHELAHALAGVDHGHDARYRRAYLDVITMITNLDASDRRGTIHTDQLSDAFAAAGLDIGTRTLATSSTRHRWSDRVVTTTGRSNPICPRRSGAARQ